MKYSKPPLSYEQQIDLLESRGLIIKDREKARNILRRINYYRLSAYCIPFQSSKDCFSVNTTIEDIVELYNFDHDLRTIIFESLQVIEIFIRTLITYHLSHKYGAFGYANQKNFSSTFINHQKWIDELNDVLSRSQEVFISHYKTKYDESKHFPIWMATEVVSFGALSLLFAGLKPSDQNEIAKEFNINHEVFKSWLHHLVYIRNICAHHARLWNRVLAIKPKIPKKLDSWHKPYTIQNGRVFSSLSIIYYILKKSCEGADNFKKQLLHLFERYPTINLSSMGFKTDWFKHEIWV
jgi:abortive infection bacteriophage resistance protein